MTAPVIDGFIAALRSRGVQVSPAEKVEASRAVLAVGLESRSSFRAALKVTLTKTLEESRLFEGVFQDYFAPPRPEGRKGKNAQPAGDGGGRGGGGGGEPGGLRARPPAEPPQVERRRRREGKKLPPPAPPKGEARPVGRLSIGAPSRERSRLRRLVLSDQERQEAGLRDRPGQEKDHSGAAKTDARRVDLSSPLTPREEAALAREIPAIIQEIRLRRGRRFREGRRGRLWIKKMIRDSLPHGGVPFALPMRERRPRSPRVLVVVDVSWSVARAAGLFLLICRGLAERLRRAEFYFFVDRVAEATSAVRGWTAEAARRSGAGPLLATRPPIPERNRGARPRGRGRGTPGEGIVPRGGGANFTALLRTVPGLNLAAPSDYGRAFFQARQVIGRAGGRDTVLVVLGDARTNRRDPLAWAFEEVASRCRRVIWLNPEPRRLWNQEDSVMDAYLPACDVACEVRDLDGLARGVREILRAM